MKYTKIIEFTDIKVSLLEVWNNLAKCILTALILLVIGVLFTLGDGVENTYSASSILYCPVTGTYSETNSAVQAINNYSSLIKSQKVAERALSTMGNTDLTNRNITDMISYSVSASGINLTITATSTEPSEAIEVANAVAGAFVEEMRNMTSSDVVQILSAADRAGLAEDGIVELWKKRLLLFGCGFVAAALVIFIKELFSDKIRSIDQCLITDNDVIIGVVPEISDEDE